MATLTTVTTTAVTICNTTAQKHYLIPLMINIECTKKNAYLAM